jgi:hypothetical protein
MSRVLDRPDPLSPQAREEELRRARPKSLPIAPTAQPALRRLPLHPDVRPIDQRVRPLYAV